MAITERYVSASGAGAHDGTSEANAFSWTEMVTDINTPRVGYRYWVKGNVSPSASDTITGDGTQARGNAIVGYKTTIGDLDDVGRTGLYNALVTTDLPVIAYGSTFRLNAGGADYLCIRNLKFTGTVSAPLVSVGTGCFVDQLAITNSSTNSSGEAFAASGASVVINRCDFACDGASGPSICVDLAGDARLIDCRILDCPNAAVRCASNSAVLVNCVFGKDVDGVCVDYTSVTTTFQPPTIISCTSYSGGSSFYRGPNVNIARPVVLINNYVTDGGAYFAASQYVGTANVQAIMVQNRTRDLTSGVSNGFTDWATLTTVRHVTTAGSASADYTDSANNDLSLKPAAPGRGVGVLGNDMGAIVKRGSRASFVG